MTKSGVHGVNLETWFGLMAPAGTPSAVIATLNRALNTVLMRPRLQGTLAAQGYVLPAVTGHVDHVAGA